MSAAPPAPAGRKSGDASWAPVFWSIAVYPGIGQWMQQRRNAGTFYCTVFTVLALMFSLVLFSYLRQVIPVMRDALQGLPLEGREIPPLTVILQPFGAVLFVYIANAVDVLRGRANLHRASAAPARPDAT